MNIQNMIIICNNSYIKHVKVTGITYQGVKFSSNHCLLEAIENAMHYCSHVMNKLLAMAK